MFDITIQVIVCLIFLWTYHEIRTPLAPGCSNPAINEINAGLLVTLKMIELTLRRRLDQYLGQCVIEASRIKLLCPLVSRVIIVIS